MTSAIAIQSATAKAGVQPNKRPEADAFQFRAPRHGDLVVCPYCPSRGSIRCDYCGGEGSLFASDLTYFEENQCGRA